MLQSTDPSNKEGTRENVLILLRMSNRYWELMERGNLVRVRARSGIRMADDQEWAEGGGKGLGVRMEISGNHF